ncbi:hypothetical protein QE399_003899 [Paracidovorax wautersii]|uniref:Uncharacterized protein n=1 Tax=Paracidovorax wautersii TaxID=1177982 RepID=A0ABU1IG62_9BURK|nr:hypothetical protein [Paracidovorax wautersii]
MHIFRIRSGGYRASRTSIWQSSVAGWLDYRMSLPDDYGPRWEAHLRAAPGGRDLITPLQWARIRRIDGVLHLAGREECGRPNTKAKSDLQPQSWLCALTPGDAEPLIARIRFTSATGYTADEDDEYEPFPPETRQ